MSEETTKPKRTRRAGTCALMITVSTEHKAFIEEAAKKAGQKTQVCARRVLLADAARVLDRLPPPFDYGHPGRTSDLAKAAAKAGMSIKDFRKRVIDDAVAGALEEPKDAQG